MRRISLALAVAALATAPAGAVTTDPLGDFLATYTGPQSAELDFTRASAVFDGTNFNLGLTLAGAPTRSANVLHVWGIDRGAGIPRLNILFDPDLDPSVKWDSLAVLFGDGTLRVVTFPQLGTPTITQIAGGAVFSGNSVSASVPLSLLGSRGFTPLQYQFQLWSRLRINPLVDGPNTEIADFGPRIAAVVPEPGTWALMIGGFGLVGIAVRRRPRLAPA